MLFRSRTQRRGEVITQNERRYPTLINFIRLPYISRELGWGLDLPHSAQTAGLDVLGGGTAAEIMIPGKVNKTLSSFAG